MARGRKPKEVDYEPYLEEDLDYEEELDEVENEEYDELYFGRGTHRTSFFDNYAEDIDD